MSLYSETAERAVLATALIDGPRYAPEICSELTEHDFYVGEYKRIFQAVRALLSDGQHIDLTTVKARAGELVRYSTLAGLDVDLPNLSALPSYMNELRTYTIRRRIQDYAMKLLDVTPKSLDRKELLALAEEGLSAAVALDSQHVVYGPRDHARVINDLLDREGEVVGLSTGFLDLDAQLGGVFPSNLVIAAGRPGMGKSLFALRVAREALDHGPVLIFSLEMSHDELVQRMAAAEAGIDHQRLRQNRISDEEAKLLRDAGQELLAKDLIVIDRGDLKVGAMVAHAQRMARAKGDLALVIVDYLQLVEAERRFDKRDQEVAYISRRCKQMAKEVDAPVLALSQLNRESEKRKDHRPTMAELRESGALEQDADQILLLYREEEYFHDLPADRRNVLEVCVAKNRHGDKGVVKLYWEAEKMQIKNLAWHRRGA